MNFVMWPLNVKAQTLDIARKQLTDNKLRYVNTYVKKRYIKSAYGEMKC